MLAFLAQPKRNIVQMTRWDRVWNLFFRRTQNAAALVCTSDNETV